MSGGGGSNTTVTKSDPWEGAQPYMLQGLEAAGNLFGQGAYEVTPYMWDRVAPQSDLTQAGQFAIANRALGGNPVTKAAENAVVGATDMDNQYRYMDQVRENVLDRVMPRVNDQFSSAGMAGSSLHSASAADAATRALADVEYGAYDSAANRALQAASLAPEMDKAGYLGATMLGQAGQMQDAYNQAIINSDMDFWREMQSAPIEAVERFGGLMTGYGGQGGTSSSSSGYKPGAMDYLGGALQMLPLMFMMSDERTKTNKVKVGELPSGLPVYEYDYIDTLPPRQIGVMAQDAEKLFPEAVLEIDGVKHVNYGLLR